eukprot:EG_transcript_14767
MWWGRWLPVLLAGTDPNYPIWGHIRPAAARNVVLVAEDGAPANVALFLRSAVAHFSADTDIVVLTGVARQRDMAAYLQRLPVSNATARVESRAYNLSAVGHPSLPTATNRFFLYESVLRGWRARYAKALLVDGRDVVFQGDLFARLPEPASYIFLEAHRIPEVHGGAFVLRHCFPRVASRSLLRRTKIACSGVLAGTLPELLALLRLQVQAIRGPGLTCMVNSKASSLPPAVVDSVTHMLDQAVLNAVLLRLQEEKATSRLRVHYFGGRSSPVQHLAGLSLPKYTWSSAGQLLLSPDADRGPAVVHQVDRHPALYFYFHALYGLRALPRRHALKRLADGAFERIVAGHRTPDTCPRPATRVEMCGVLGLYRLPAPPR